MVIIGNKKGHSTIESIIIVPLIITIIVSFIMLIISGYQYYVEIFNGTYQSMIDGSDVEAKGHYRTLFMNIDKGFNYQNKNISSRRIQEITEYLIYLEDIYLGETHE